MIRKIVCKNERTIKCFIAFGILSFLSLLSVGGVFIYESFHDKNIPAVIGISISLVILIVCIFLPSFIYCKCNSYEESNIENMKYSNHKNSDSSDSDFEISSLHFLNPNLIV